MKTPRNIAISVLCAALVAGALSTALASDEEHIRTLIRQLGDESAQTREAADAELRVIGAPAIPLLEAAARETDDPEVAARAGAIVEGYQEARWNALLEIGLGAEAFRKEVGDAWDSRKDEDPPQLDEAELRDSVARIPTGDVASLLTEPCRFYTVDGAAFSLLSRPPTILVVGLSESGEAFLVGVSIRRCGGLDRLKRRMKPVKSAEQALGAAALVARLSVLCVLCGTGTKGAADPAKGTVESLDGGGFRVTLPPEVFSPNPEGEGAVITFGPDGLVRETARTGHKMGHH